jgi:hypothetical protein
MTTTMLWVPCRFITIQHVMLAPGESLVYVQLRCQQQLSQAQPGAGISYAMSLYDLVPRIVASKASSSQPSGSTCGDCVMVLHPPG